MLLQEQDPIGIVLLSGSHHLVAVRNSSALGVGFVCFVSICFVLWGF